MTGTRDFADITVRYVADRKCVELKSLKLFSTPTERGIFFEAVTNRSATTWRGVEPRSLDDHLETGKRAAIHVGHHGRVEEAEVKG